jgi:hypothetical protein
VPDFFTEQFSSFDLANQRILLFPTGGVDFYSGCVEPIVVLPTDPAGGTTVSLSDDDSEVVVLSGGHEALLYGTSYIQVYIGSNGYLTLGAGDTTYSETLADHFDTPRVAALFDDFNPSDGGTVSYKELADRFVVTWENVPEYSTTNSNTYQIELYYDGTIGIAYLDMAASDGIAGLSAGTGLDPDYYPSDLSTMGSCGPRPPVASSLSVETPADTPLEIELLAGDDGLPDPPGALTYIITSLPDFGALEELGGGAITTVPYILSGNQVVYTPDTLYQGPDQFQFKVDDGGVAPEGGESGIATIGITVGVAALVYDFPLDTDPGWTTTGDWAFGVPTGGSGSSGGPDPTSGFTGTNVYGYNLAGGYPNNMDEETLTTTAIDCTNLTDVRVEFQRWLGVESSTYDHATFQVSTDGGTWNTVWDHSGSSFTDPGWTLQAYDISAFADGQATVFLRWVMGDTDGSVTYCGWNIDDVQIYGVQPTIQLPCPWDMAPDNGGGEYGNGIVNVDDFFAVLQHWGPCPVGDCPWDCHPDNGNGTFGDGAIDVNDFFALLQHWGLCPIRSYAMHAPRHASPPHQSHARPRLPPGAFDSPTSFEPDLCLQVRIRTLNRDYRVWVSRQDV